MINIFFNTQANIINTLGYKLPTVLLDLCQQENRLQNDVKAVDSLVILYNNIMDKLDANKVKYQQIKKVHDKSYNCLKTS